MERLLELALVGLRAHSFHHDVATKLQSLFFALDELVDRTAIVGDDRIDRAVVAATSSARDIQRETAAFRAISRSAATGHPLREILHEGAGRVGATIEGEAPDCTVVATRDAAIQAVAIAFELVAAEGAVTAAIEARGKAAIALVLTGDGNGRVRGLTREDAFAIIRFVQCRDGGDAKDLGDRIVLVFPIGPTATQTAIGGM